MSRILELILLVILTCAIENASSQQRLKQNRIFDGTIVKEKQFPFMVAIITWSNRIGCSGSLIAAQKVISAAHCFDKGHPFHFVEAGNVDVYSENENPNKQKRKISNAVRHPDFDDFLTNNGYTCRSRDIAIVTIEYPFDITDYVSPIKMAESNLEINSSIIIAGFGRYAHQEASDGKARCGNFQIDEIKIYRDDSQPVYISIPVTQYKTQLSGDSGGSVVSKCSPYILHGVHSAGNRKTYGVEAILSIKRNRDFILKQLNLESTTRRKSGQKTISEIN